jgi:hypothetical protein
MVHKLNHFVAACLLTLAVTFCCRAETSVWSYTVQSLPDDPQPVFGVHDYTGDGRGGFAITWYSHFTSFYAWLDSNGTVIASGEFQQGSGGGGLQVMSITPSLLTLNHTQYDNSEGYVRRSRNAVVRVQKKSQKTTVRELPLKARVKFAKRRLTEKHAFFTVEEFQRDNPLQYGAVVRRYSTK